MRGPPTRMPATAVALATFKRGGDIAIRGFIHWKSERDLLANAEVVAQKIRDLEEE